MAGVKQMLDGMRQLDMLRRIERLCDERILVVFRLAHAGGCSIRTRYM